MSPGTYKFLADALVLFHMGFVTFVLLGGAIVLRWRWVMCLHLPAVAWGIFIELSHKICPLTPLENHLRAWGGAATYQGGFVDHYIMPVLYPNGLTHNMQVAIAVLIVVLNTAAYGWVIAGKRISGRAAMPEHQVVTSVAPKVEPSSPAGGMDVPPELAGTLTRDVR